MKIAIIGAGISGLVAAYRLDAEHDITVFEAAEKPGGHANTVHVDDEGESLAIDTGFIVFNEWTDPRFNELLNELNVASKPTQMGFSVRDDRTGLEYAGQNLNSLFAQRRNLLSPKFLRMIRDILRFNNHGFRQAESLPVTATVGEFLREGGYSIEFAQQHLLPMGAAIWSCPLGTFEQFPIRFILEYYRNHGLLNVVYRPGWRVITGGSETYVKALTAPFLHRICLKSPVISVRRLSDRVTVLAQNRIQDFDHVIFACHSDQALRILGAEATRLEQEILGKFLYGRNVALLHTDDRILPVNRRAWASWNYRLTGDPSAPATVTYNMNILQGHRSKNVYCVTLNDEHRINPSKIMARFEYHHSIFTPEWSAVQARHAELLLANRTSYCGGYWRNGFHENGVVSALKVVDAIQSLSESRPSTLNRGRSVAGSAS